MKSYVFSRYTRGFTLLELMIGMTLLVSLAAVIGFAMRLEGRSVQSGNQRIESLERFRTAVMYFNSQIRSYTPQSLRKDSETASAFVFKGDENKLQIPTNYSVWNGLKGCVIAEYRIEPAGLGKKSIYLRERGFFTDDPQDTLLIEGLDEVSFEYYHRDPTQEEGIWIHAWSDETVAPERVRIRMAYRGKPHSIALPVPSCSHPEIQAVSAASTGSN